MYQINYQKNHLILSQLSSRRYKWQIESIDSIKRELRILPLYEGITFDQESLAVVCGLPQCGKTEMILELISVSPSYIEDVYDTLRAGQPEGTSSTSTAISYKKSTTNCYEITCSSRLIDPSLNLNPNIMQTVRYDNKNEVKEVLKSIRKKIENGYVNSDLVTIGIPDSYFKENVSEQYLHLIDLPGLQSSNLKEQNHVLYLAKKYIPLSNVIIFIWKSNLISRMEGSTIEQTLNSIYPPWKKDPQRIIIVTTQSFTSSSLITKNTIFSESEVFCEKIKKNCINETKKYLPSESNFEIFPVEIGKSKRRINLDYPLILQLGNEFIQNIHKINDITIDDLKSAIYQRHNSLPLKSIISWNRQVEEKAIYERKRIENEIELHEKVLRKLENENDDYRLKIEKIIEQKKENQVDELEFSDSMNKTLSKLNKNNEEILDNCNKLMFTISGYRFISEKNYLMLRENIKSNILLIHEKYIQKKIINKDFIARNFSLSHFDSLFSLCYVSNLLSHNGKNCYMCLNNQLTPFLKLSIKNLEIEADKKMNYIMSNYSNERNNLNEMINNFNRYMEINSQKIKSIKKEIENKRKLYAELNVNANKAIKVLNDSKKTITEKFNLEIQYVNNNLQNNLLTSDIKMVWYLYNLLIRRDFVNITNIFTENGEY